MLEIKLEILVFVFLLGGFYIVYTIAFSKNNKNNLNTKNENTTFSSSNSSQSNQPLELTDDQQAILDSANSMARVLNESLQLANTSKNPSTKISRLKVASDTLQQLKMYVTQHPFIILERLDKVEKTISDLNQEFLNAGYFNLGADEIHRARDLLKVATQLKKEKRFNEACEKLREAYSANGSEELMIEDYLRLPMYLQLAGRSDEGWKALDEIRIQNKDNFNESTIAKQIKIFFRKEKKYELALLFSAWEICEIIENDHEMIQKIINMSDEYAELPERDEFGFQPFIPYTGIQTGTTPKGNPIRHQGYHELTKRITKTKSHEFIEETLLKDLVKTKFTDRLDALTKDLQQYINSKKEYHLNEVMLVVSKHITSDLSIIEDIPALA